jgi:hypothetical protein
MLQYFLDKQIIEAPHQGNKTEKPVSPETEDNRNISGTSFLTSHKDSAANTGTASRDLRETIRAEIQTSVAELCTELLAEHSRSRACQHLSRKGDYLQSIELPRRTSSRPKVNR